MNDEEIRSTLEDIDNSERVDVTDWEARFIESVVYRQNGSLSDKQRESAIAIIRKYEGKL